MLVFKSICHLLSLHNPQLKRSNIFSSPPFINVLVGCHPFKPTFLINELLFKGFYSIWPHKLLLIILYQTITAQERILTVQLSERLIYGHPKKGSVTFLPYGKNILANTNKQCHHWVVSLEGMTRCFLALVLFSLAQIGSRLL